jgi:hypothetical protein
MWIASAQQAAEAERQADQASRAAQAEQAQQRVREALRVLLGAADADRAVGQPGDDRLWLDGYVFGLAKRHLCLLTHTQEGMFMEPVPTLAALGRTLKQAAKYPTWGEVGHL